MNDLLLPIYLFVVYFVIVCWIQQPIQPMQIEKSKSAQIKNSSTPAKIKQFAPTEPLVQELPVPKTTRRKKQNLSDVIRAA